MTISGEFSWEGEGKAIHRRKPNELHYESFKTGKLHVKIGDFVLIRNDDSMDPEDPFTCFVAQVTDLFDTGDEGEEPFRAKVQWYSRISELPKHLSKKLSDIDDCYELFEQKNISWDENVDAESIFGKCVVEFFSVDSKPESFSSRSNGMPHFFCRYKAMSNKIVPVFEDANGYKTPRRGKVDSKVTLQATPNTASRRKMPVTPPDETPPEKKAGLTPLIITLSKINCNSDDDTDRYKIVDNSTVKSSRATPTNHHQTRKNKTPINESKKDDSKIVNKFLALSPMMTEIKMPIVLVNKMKPSELTPRCKTSPRRRNILKEKAFSSNKLETRRRLNFMEDNEDTVTTRYGRRVKSFSSLKDSLALLDSPKKSKPNVKTEKKNVKFYHSDVSDSEESNFNPSDDNNSSDSDNSVHDFEIEKVSLKKLKTPSRSSMKGTPLSSKKSLTFASPSLPERLHPVKKPVNPLEESRQRLHVSAVPNSLPCRDEEYSDIYAFIESNLVNHSGGCMYVSGVPGTGKTATVHEVMRNMERERDCGNLPSFQFIEVNGMKMTDPYQCYVQIFKALTGQRIAPQQASNMLEKRFTKPGPKNDAVVLLVDELDKLWTRKQTVMYNLFDWPTKASSKLIVISIANTMDLPERLMMNRVSSRLGLTRKIFQPYTFKELQEIVMSRIDELDVFDPDAVQLVARKVAAVSGDARRALEICRRAAEVAQEGIIQVSPTKRKRVMVGMEHVDAALNQMLTSPEVAAIRGCSEYQKMFFKSLLSEFERTGTEEATLFKVYRQLVELCRFEGYPPPSSSQISTMCSHLTGSYLILVDNFQNDLFMKIRLNVSADDVNYALTGRAM